MYFGYSEKLSVTFLFDDGLYALSVPRSSLLMSGLQKFLRYRNLNPKVLPSLSFQETHLPLQLPIGPIFDVIPNDSLVLPINIRDDVPSGVFFGSERNALINSIKQSLTLRATAGSEVDNDLSFVTKDLIDNTLDLITTGVTKASNTELSEQSRNFQERITRNKGKDENVSIRVLVTEAQKISVVPSSSTIPTDNTRITIIPFIAKGNETLKETVVNALCLNNVDETQENKGNGTGYEIVIMGVPAHKINGMLDTKVRDLSQRLSHPDGFFYISVRSARVK